MDRICDSSSLACSKEQHSVTLNREQDTETINCEYKGFNKWDYS